MFFEMGGPVFDTSMVALTGRACDKADKGTSKAPRSSGAIEEDIRDRTDNFDEAMVRFLPIGAKLCDGHQQAAASNVDFRARSAVPEYTDRRQRRTIQINRFIPIESIDTCCGSRKLQSCSGGRANPSSSARTFTSGLRELRSLHTRLSRTSRVPPTGIRSGSSSLPARSD